MTYKVDKYQKRNKKDYPYYKTCRLLGFGLLILHHGTTVIKTHKIA